MTEQFLVDDRVVKTVTVPLPRDAAFDLFTVRIAEWWPLSTHSVAADTYAGRLTVTELRFEPDVGGRIVESLSDGSQAEWGRVLVWEPPNRVAFSWKPNLTAGPHTRVEVTFSPVGSDDSRTVVELVHTGWGAFDGSAEERRRRYDQGWEPVLQRLVAAAGG
jgi:uncharacterized protein YndB with AHSA1/START domain